MAHTTSLAFAFALVSSALVGCSVYRSSDREYFDSHARAGAPSASSFGAESTRLIQESGASSCERVTDVSSQLARLALDSLDLSTDDLDSSLVETPNGARLASAARDSRGDLIVCAFEISRASMHDALEKGLAETRARAESLVRELSVNADH